MGSTAAVCCVTHAIEMSLFFCHLQRSAIHFRTQRIGLTNIGLRLSIFEFDRKLLICDLVDASCFMVQKLFCLPYLANFT